MKTSYFLFLSLLPLIISCSNPTNSTTDFDNLYVGVTIVDSSNSSVIYNLNIDSKTFTDSTIIYQNYIDGIDYDPFSQKFYITSDMDSIYTIRTLSDSLYTISYAGRIASIAINPIDSTLLGISIGGDLYSINKISGDQKFIGNYFGDYEYIHSLEINNDGTIFAVSTHGPGTSTLYIIDILNGNSEVVAQINKNYVTALAFGKSGTLYGLDNATKTLFSIDITSGSTNEIMQFVFTKTVSLLGLSGD